MLFQLQVAADTIIYFFFFCNPEAETHNVLQAKITLCQERKSLARKDPKEKIISNVVKKSNKYWAFQVLPQ